MHQTTVRVGIDVSKHCLAIALYPTTQAWDLPNQPAAWQQLAESLQAYAVHSVLLEGAGVYEKGMVHTLRRAGFPVVIVPPQRARYFAKSLRGNLKTDRVDAQVLAQFATLYAPPYPSVGVFGSGGGGGARCAVACGVRAAGGVGETEEGGVVCGGASVVGGVEREDTGWEGV